MPALGPFPTSLAGLDDTIGLATAAQGSLLYRGDTAWQALSPPEEWGLRALIADEEGVHWGSAVPWQINLYQGADGEIPLEIEGRLDQGGFHALTRWLMPSTNPEEEYPVEVAALDSAGGLTLAGGLDVRDGLLSIAIGGVRVGVGTVVPGARLHIRSSSVGVPTLITQAAASQSADLFQARNSSGTALTVIDAAGNLAVGTSAVTAGYGLDVAGKALLRTNVVIGSNTAGIGLYYNSASDALNIRDAGDTLFRQIFALRFRGATNGTAADPPFTFRNNAHCGVYAVGTNQVAISTASTERLRVESDGGVSVGGNAPDTSALLDLQSTTRGFLPPRMTTAQRDSISNPATGLEIFNTTIGRKQFWDGDEWQTLIALGDIM